MSVRIEIPYKKTLSFQKNEEAVLELLKKPIDLIAPHFPGLESLTHKEGSLYEWKFETIKYSNFSTQIILDTLLVLAGNTLTMTPQGKAPHSLRGTWTVKPQGAGSEISLDFILKIELPIPGLMRAMAEPIAKKELTQLFDKFTTNVQKAHT